jgi:hypothetical protein
MSRTPAWYPGKAEAAIDDEADTLEVLALQQAGGSLVLETSIICPACGFRGDETMSGIEPVHFYTCKGCNKVLKPIYGDCCVFCSYATVVCPGEQRRELEEAGQSIRRYVGDLREKLQRGE